MGTIAVAEPAHSPNGRFRCFPALVASWLWRLLTGIAVRLWRRAFPKAEKRWLLDGVELKRRLSLESPDLIDDAQALGLQKIQAEEQRESRLDGKAQGLLASTALSLTVAFSFGGLVLKDPQYLDGLRVYEIGRHDATLVVVWLYAGALVCGLLASYVAMRALYVRGGYKVVDIHAVLGSILPLADRQGDAARATYRRYVAGHYWQIAQVNERLYDRKADRIKLGQRLFLGFLVCLIAIGFALCFAARDSVLHHKPSSEDKCMNGNKSTPATSTPSPAGTNAPRPSTQPVQIPASAPGASTKKNGTPKP
jgi:hypothetical protein